MLEIRFVDSLKFLASSLDNLVSNMPKDQFFQTQKVFGDKTYLFLKKGVYPYEYIKGPKNFEETKLPGRDLIFIQS